VGAKSIERTRQVSRSGDGAGRGRVRIYGAEAQTRTGDTGLFRAVLYLLSYLGTICGDDRI
jgi:hypothetical protein